MLAALEYLCVMHKDNICVHKDNSKYPWVHKGNPCVHKDILTHWHNLTGQIFQLKNRADQSYRNTENSCFSSLPCPCTYVLTSGISFSSPSSAKNKRKLELYLIRVAKNRKSGNEIHRQIWIRNYCYSRSKIVSNRWWCDTGLSMYELNDFWDCLSDFFLDL